MKALPDVPFILSCMLGRAGRIDRRRTDRTPAWPRCQDGLPRPIAWGINCGTGPDGLLGAVERAVRVIDLPLVVQPNAGIPKEVDNRRIYFCSPEYLTEYAKRFVNLGASCVGGCCGTTPEHIREMARTIKPLSRRRTEPIVKEVTAVPLKAAAPMAEKSETWQAAGRRAMGDDCGARAAAGIRSFFRGSQEPNAPRARRHRDQHS